MMLPELAIKRKTLLGFGARAVAAVDARVLVERRLQRWPQEKTAVLAIGKAAPAMAAGAMTMLGGIIVSGLVVAPGAAPPLQAGWLFRQGGHPVPDERSLHAGRTIGQWLADLPEGLPLLVLLSGGASALAEIPVDGLDLARLQQINRWLLGSGLDIRTMNAIRARFSCLKRGGLLRMAGARAVHGLVISDVPGNAFADIGSGPLSAEPAPWPGNVALPEWLENLHASLARPEACAGEARLELLACNRDALDAASHAVVAHGLEIVERGVLEGDAALAGRDVARRVRDGRQGIHLLGGETTVSLPPSPGCGGRNQHLALAAAEVLEGDENVLLLALASDGVDGNTDDAGALVDGGTMRRIRDSGFDAFACMQGADSNRALAAAGDVVHTGPTGTNVMDLVIAWKTA